MVRRAVKNGSRVIATGCYAQLRPEILSQITGVELVIGNTHKNRLTEFVEALQIKDNGNTNHISTDVIIESPEAPVTSGGYYSTRARAFLKIQDGCNFSCSYCVVPKARGRSRSLGHKEILKALDELYARNYRETVFTGIHIGHYGLDLHPKTSLVEFIKKAMNRYSDMRFRITSLEPQEFKKELLHVIKQGNVCKHLHIPLQSGSDRILKAMKRNYSAEFYKNMIREVVAEVPNISIGTDIIVGFPREGEEEYEETVRFAEELPLSYIHVFPYSKRPDTEASGIKKQVKNVVKKQRAESIREISKKKKKEYILRQLGGVLDVIIEDKSIINGFYRAISDNYVRTLVRAENLKTGQRLRVKASVLDNGTLISIPLW
jgi:threonylcarbamoyladenosine tRNA methylthiotransferase MtaB